MKTVCLTLAAFALAAPARADVPGPPQCTVDHVIISSWNETPSPAGGLAACAAGAAGFDVVVRDAFGTPVPFSHVQIVFGGTGTGIRPYQNLGPGPVTAQCLDYSLRVDADGMGRVHFVPHFGRWAETRVVPVYADGVQIALIEARSPDYDGDGDVDLSDLTTFSGDYLDTQNYRARSDFDDCAGSTLGDFVFFVGQYLASGATGVPRPVCN